MLKTTNATPQKYSSEGVSISRRRTFRRIKSPPHSAINIYVRNDIEKITKPSVISRKIAFDKSIVKKRFSVLLKRHLTQTADSGISHDTATASDPVRLGVVASYAKGGISLASRSAERSDGVVGFRWKPSRCLHHRQRRQCLHSGPTGLVGRRMAREKAQRTYESNKHDDFFHLKFPFQCPISKRDGLTGGSGVPIRKIDLATG
jgi:hypothetical protein